MTEMLVFTLHLKFDAKLITMNEITRNWYNITKSELKKRNYAYSIKIIIFAG